MASTDTCYIRKLRGHKKPINSIDSSVHDGNVIASGSNDCTVRVWDARQERAIKSIYGVFKGPIDTVCFDEQSEWLLHCTEACNLYSFDLRTESVIMTSSKYTRPNLTGDDFNAMRCLKTGESSILALSDDSGQLTMVNGSLAEIAPTYIPNAHTSIMSAVAFRYPQSGSSIPREIATGGFDCRVCLWDILSNTQRSAINFSDPKTSLLGRAGDTQAQQFLNPPFVHCLEFVCNGEIIVCGLGDGSVSGQLIKSLLLV